MKITKSQLKQIIKEEIGRVLNEDIHRWVEEALEDADLPTDTKLAGYGIIGGGWITLIPENPKLYAQNWDERTGKDVHTQYIMIKPEKVGSDTEIIAYQLEKMGLRQERTHTGAGWM